MSTSKQNNFRYVLCYRMLYFALVDRICLCIDRATLSDLTITFAGNAPRTAAVADTIFIHGLGGDGQTTWQVGGDASTFWPLWIFNQLTALNVWSLTYPAATLGWGKSGDGVLCLIEPKRSWTCFAQMESAHDRSSLSLIVYCPSCFAAVEALPENASDHCHLCKSLLSNSDRGSRTLAVKLDLQIQQRESRQLQDERLADLESVKSQLKSLRRDHQSKSATYDALSRAPISSRDAKIGTISRRIGFIEQSLVNLQEKIELANKFDAMVAERDTLNATIGRLGDEIKAIVARQDRRKREAYTQIANLRLDFLRRDTGTQDDFVDPKLLEFSFGDDAVFVDGKSNFAASSLVVLKNS